MHLTRWLAQFPGDTWQARWVASDLDGGGTPWPEETDHNRRGLLFKGRPSADLPRRDPAGLPLAPGHQLRLLFDTYRRANDPASFDTLERTLRELRITDRVIRDAVTAAIRICMRTGKGTPAKITAEDVIHLDTVLRESGRTARSSHEALWRALHHTGQISGPTSLKAAHRDGPLSAEQLVDRYRLRCKPIRDLIVTYITERATSMDYTSVSNLAFWLGKLFWADLEHHHPGIDSLRLAPDVAAAWKNVSRSASTVRGRLETVVTGLRCGRGVGTWS